MKRNLFRLFQYTLLSFLLTFSDRHLTLAETVAPDAPFNVYKEVNIFQYVKKDELKMTPFRYRAYIRPQLRSIRAEFYQLLKRVRPNHDYLIDLKTHSERIEGTWRSWNEECIEVTEDCLSGLNTLYSQVQRLDVQLMELQGHSLLSFSDLGAQSEEIFDLSKTFDDMSLTTYRILHYIEQMRILTETPYLRENELKSSINRHIDRLRTFSEIVLTSLVSHKYKDLFDSLWRNYIRPIDREILGKNNPEYLMIYLERLNHSFNEFHMRLSKGRHQLPEEELKMINTIHRRWNTILRILVRDIE